MLVTNKMLIEHGAVMSQTYLTNNMSPVCHKPHNRSLVALFDTDIIKKVIEEKYARNMNDYSRNKMIKTTTTILEAIKRIEDDN